MSIGQYLCIGYLSLYLRAIHLLAYLSIYLRVPLYLSVYPLPFPPNHLRSPEGIARYTMSFGHSAATPSIYIISR